MAGAFYRLTAKGLALGTPTDASAWLRPYETRKSSMEGMTTHPEAHGLSIYASLEELVISRNLNPRTRAKTVAEVMIAIADGDLLHSPIPDGTTHHDWWTAPYDLIPVARIVKEGGTP
jgi:hypothetical protein